MVSVGTAFGLVFVSSIRSYFFKRVCLVLISLVFSLILFGFYFATGLGLVLIFLVLTHEFILVLVLAVDALTETGFGDNIG